MQKYNEKDNEKKQSIIYKKQKENEFKKEKKNQCYKISQYILFENKNLKKKQKEIEEMKKKNTNKKKSIQDV